MPLRVGANYEKEQETPNKQSAEAIHIQGHRSAARDESILLGLGLLVALEIHRGALVNREFLHPAAKFGRTDRRKPPPKKRAALFNKNFDLRRRRERSGEKPPKIANGQKNLFEYRREWLRHDAVAGVSVNAVALPTAIACAQLYWLRSGGGLGRGDPAASGLCGLWHLAPPYHKSGRCHVCHGRATLMPRWRCGRYGER